MAEKNPNTLSSASASSGGPNPSYPAPHESAPPFESFELNPVNPNLAYNPAYPPSPPPQYSAQESPYLTAPNVNYYPQQQNSNPNLINNDSFQQRGSQQNVVNPYIPASLSASTNSGGYAAAASAVEDNPLRTNLAHNLYSSERLTALTEEYDNVSEYEQEFKRAKHLCIVVVIAIIVVCFFLIISRGPGGGYYYVGGHHHSSFMFNVKHKYTHKIKHKYG